MAETVPPPSTLPASRTHEERTGAAVAAPVAQYNTDLLVCVLLAAATLASYAHACRNGLLAVDDRDYVTRNEQVRAGLSKSGLHWALITLHAGNWHPLTWLSLQLDSTLFGVKPWGYHLTNILLHTANALLLFLALRWATGTVWRSALAAGLLALHPLHVESVAWVAERKDVLSTFFGMLTLLAYLAYAPRPGPGRYVLVLLAFTLGLMAKSMLVTLPCVLLLLDYWPLQRLRLANVIWLLCEKVPLFLLAACSCIITCYAQEAGAAVISLERIPLSARLGNALVSYAAYLHKTVWPSGLAAHYPHPLHHFALWQVLGTGLLLAGLTAAAVLLWRRAPYLLVGWLWFLGTLVPVLGVVQVGLQAMADRYSYVPLIGPFVALSWGLADLAARWHCRRLLAGAAVAALAVCAALTWLQVRYWRDDVTLWTHAIQVTEGNFFAYNALGALAAEDGRFAEARDFYQQAIDANPRWASPHYSLGVAHAMLGDTKAAEEHYLEAIHLKPNYAEAYNNLGSLLLGQGQLDRAADCYAEAARLWPESAMIHNNLGLARARQGKMPEAIARHRRAVELAPRDLRYRCNLAAVLFEQGQSEAGRAEYDTALRLDPNWPGRQNRQARLLATSPEARGRNGQEAVRLAKQVCQATEEATPEFLDTLAAAFAEAGRFEDARLIARQALQLATAAGNVVLAEQVREHLRFYEDCRPLREEPEHS